MTEAEAWLGLNAAELPPRTVLDLLEHYGSPVALMEAGASAVAVAGRLKTPEMIRLSAAAKRDFRPDVEKLKRLGGRLVMQTARALHR